MVRDPFLDWDDGGPGGGCLRWALALWVWFAALTVWVVGVALGPAAAAGVAAVFFAAALWFGFAGFEARELDEPVVAETVAAHPASSRRPAIAVDASPSGGFIVVELARSDVLLNLSDADCELCQDHPGRAGHASLEPCVCTEGKRGRWW